MQAEIELLTPGSPPNRVIVSGMDAERELLRHTLATLAYRLTRALGGAPEEFADYAGAGRTPLHILSHMGDLLEWALTIVQGKESWPDSDPLPWEDEKRRFFAGLKALDDVLARREPIHGDPERLFQGPIADAISHTGQLAMLRRLAGGRMKGENYYVAKIEVGQTGEEQPEPVQPF